MEGDREKGGGGSSGPNDTSKSQKQAVGRLPRGTGIDMTVWGQSVQVGDPTGWTGTKGSPKRLAY